MDTPLAAALPRTPKTDSASLFTSRLLARAAEASSYFVGFLGTATYAMASDAFGIASLMLVSNLFVVIGSAIAGPITDKLGPRRTVLAANLLSALVFVTYPFWPQNLASLGIFISLWALTIGCQTNGYTTYPPYLFADKGLKDANGLLGIADNAGNILGPLVGGLITALISLEGVFFASALLNLVSCLFIWRLTELRRPVEAEDKADVAEAGGFRRYVMEGVRTTLRSPFLRLLLVMGFFGYFAYGAFDALESLFYRDVLAVGPEWLGWLNVALGSGLVGGSLIMMRLPDRWLSLRGAAMMLVVTGLGTVVYVATAHVGIAAVGQVLTGLGFGALVPTQNLLVQEMTDLSVTGRVMAVMKIGYQSAGILPLLASPFLAEIFGVQGVLVGAAVICTAIGALFFVAIPARLSHGDSVDTDVDTDDDPGIPGVAAE